MTDTPTGLPVLPLKGSVLFPRLLMPLTAGRDASVQAVEAAVATEDKALMVVAQRDPEVEEPGRDDLYAIGTRAVVKRMERTQAGVQLIVLGVERMEIVAFERNDFARVEVRPRPLPTDDSAEVQALHRAMVDLAGQVVDLIGPQLQAALAQTLAQVQDPLQKAYLIASMIGLDQDKEQALLEAETREAALRMVCENLTNELHVRRLQQEISHQAQSELSREQREHILRRQLQAIQQELGDTGPEQAAAQELAEKIAAAELPEPVRKEADRELQRLERLHSASPDYQLTRTWLELVVELPWRKRTEDVLDLPRAREILDEDHYDLKDVKERIVEHLAVLKLNPTAKAPILCFVGPPGVGKTSLGRSIARALGRQFERLALGGMSDEAELRGHRRTYIGAMPGRIVHAIRRAGVSNPVLMLDEVDKLGRDFRGDPAAALLEVLDPAQNHEFRDNYLDLPFDLSKVFFITTANTLDTIPRPLLDRMEVLWLSGYSDDEKLHIARRYLLPRQIVEAGLQEDQVSVPDETLLRVARRYTREAGVRQLERRIGSLCRKVAIRFAEGRNEPVTIEPTMLSDMLGPERFFEEDARTDLAPGVAAGLAWTPTGGEVLYIEAVRLPDGRGLTLTGQLGEVMRESAQAAHSYLGSRAHELGIEQERLKGGVHVHVPAGAVPKDGPSAGVAISAALASLYADKPVRSDTAMTGEITLSGLVLPVGGIKEKVLGAHRAGIRRVLLPRRNLQDLRELPQHVRQQLDVIAVDTILDVLREAVPSLSPAGIAAS